MTLAPMQGDWSESHGRPSERELEYFQDLLPGRLRLFMEGHHPPHFC